MVQIGAQHQVYNLSVSNDTNSNGHTQWFYFSVQGAVAGVDYTFHIKNFQKEDSLFKRGMRPCLYSPGKGWTRAGRDIKYSRTLNPGCTRHWYTLSFTLRFESAEQHFLAYAVPYSRTDLISDLDALMDDPKRARLCTRSVLCHSLSGLPVEQLRVTDPDEGDMTKRSIVVSARVHPGETVASWMMRGFMYWVTSDDPRAMHLRATHNIICIPMMNPGAECCRYYSD